MSCHRTHRMVTQRRSTAIYPGCDQPHTGIARYQSRRAAREGFSLVELIVVMVIIGMLAGIVTLSTRRYLISAKQNTAKAEIATIVEAIDSFYAEAGRYPTNEEGLAILAQASGESPDGYLKKLSKDPWKRDYEYNSPGRDNAAYEVICLGADGREGGEGENKDITSFD